MKSKLLITILLTISFIGCKTLPEPDDRLKTAVDLFNEAEIVEGEDEKLNLLSKSLELNSDYVNALTERGHIYYHNLEFDLALLDFKRAVEIQPRNFRILTLIGTIYARQGELEKSYDFFDDALIIAPDEKWILGNMAHLLYIKKDYSKALIYINRAIELEPENSNLYMQKALIYIADSNMNQGTIEINKAIEFKQDNDAAYYVRALNYAHFGNLEKAQNDLDEAINLGLDEEYTFCLFGFINFELGEYMKAIDSIYKNINALDRQLKKSEITNYEYNNEIEHSYRMLSSIYYLFEDFDTSRSYFEKLFVLDEIYYQDLDSILKHGIWSNKEKEVFTEVFKEFNSDISNSL